MSERRIYERDGFVMRRGLLAPDTVARLVGIGERLHGQWMQEHAAKARKRNLINSTGLTATRYFRPPFDSERSIFFDALADGALWGILKALFGDELYFHGTQMFFNPLEERGRPYWHRDLQYMGCDETRQQELLGELCNLHVRIPLRPERSFMLVPGSHARWDTDLERDVRLERSGHRSWEDLPSATMLALNPGDILIFSAHMLHRGTYEGNSGRLSLDLMLGKPHPQMPLTLEVGELPTADELGRLRHPQWFVRAEKLLRESRPSEHHARVGVAEVERAVRYRKVTGDHKRER